MNVKNINEEVIEQFINGRDPMERIVNLSYHYSENYVTVFYRNEEDQKCKRKESFYPFCWATLEACLKLCNGNRAELKKLLSHYKIGIKRLNNISKDGIVCEEFNNGYLFKFFAKEPMSYANFLGFFRAAGNPIYSKKEDNIDNRQYLTVTPQEQFLISTGKRFFKGYDDYDDILRMIFDLETTGLDGSKNRIVQIGIRFNRPFINHPDGFEKIISVEGDTEEEKNKCELWAIDQFLKIIYSFKPDIITGHNCENFDWLFILDSCKRLGTSIEEMSMKYFGGESIRKDERETCLKLGGEQEYFHRTIVPNIIVTDSLHAVRRAQATDSSFKKADLKYSTKYLNLGKPNRVYTPGDKISEIWLDTEEHYAFNDIDGDWYLYDENCENSDNSFKKGKIGDNPFVMYKRNYIADGYVLKSGRYIIERYLFDDLYECDKVEYSINGTDFMLTKLIPVSYQKCCTMGTAGQWKMIMLAWSFENDLAIPKAEDTGSFTGGLSRLLQTGFVGQWEDSEGISHGEEIVKLDFNSLYPSIILTWGIEDSKDLFGVTLKLLEYILTTREKHKALKKKAGKLVDSFEAKINNGEILTQEENIEYNKQKSIYKVEDNRQACVKKLGNSYFGAYGSNSGAVYPWKSPRCAEQTTCTGRQCLRLMISHFSEISKHNNLNDEDYNYTPIVGDSFTSDTPIFIKLDNGYIDIVPIKELISENDIKIDELGREYDYSNKNYKVLCRSGWVKPSYIYRHKTNKDIYEVSDNKVKINVTEDHSLFNDKQIKIKPSEINENTKLEYNVNEINGDINLDNISFNKAKEYGYSLAVDDKFDRVPLEILNSNMMVMKMFYNTFMENYNENKQYTKTCIAGLQFLRNHIK